MDFFNVHLVKSLKVFTLHYQWLFTTTQARSLSNLNIRNSCAAPGQLGHYDHIDTNP